MKGQMEEGLVSPSDIADIADVSRGAVSNWRKRAVDFPEPVAGTVSKPLFSRRDVVDWLTRRGYVVGKDAGKTDVWAALNLVRDRLSVEEAMDLVLGVAAEGGAELPDLDEAALGGIEAALRRVPRNRLGEAVDFALERLARAQGKVGAEFGFVGSRTSTLLANLAASRPGGTLYDPACGIGAALVAAVALGARPSRVVGHDINRRAIAIAAQRCSLWQVDAELEITDILAEDIDPALKADVVILEPPFGMRFNTSERLTDARFEFGVPPRSSADTAWLQHALAHLADSGRAYVLTPPATLFRTGEERAVRAELVRRGCIEAIAALPSKLLPNTAIPLALWVLRRPTEADAAGPILFIDATEIESPEKRVPEALTDPSERPRMPSIEVGIPDVLAADSVLTPQRWLSRSQHDPREAAAAYAEGWSSISDTAQEMRDVLDSYEHASGFSRSRVLTVGELEDDGIIEVVAGRPADRYKDAPAVLRSRIATAAMVRDATLHEIALDQEYSDYPELTERLDVLVTTMNKVRATVDWAGGHLPSTGVFRLRVLEPVLDAEYLANVIQGTWNARLQGGTTIKRAPLRELEVPVLPVAEQLRIDVAMRAITQLRKQAARLARETATVGDALLNAVRYNAPLTVPAALPSDDKDRRPTPEGAK